MSHLSDYSLNCDYLRDRYKMGNTVSLYEIVNEAVAEIKRIDEQSKNKSVTTEGEIKKCQSKKKV